jgi:mono/diheme cytochrome c family protein
VRLANTVAVLGTFWKSDVRHWLLLLNVIVIIGLIIYLVRTVLSPKRAAEEGKTPANLTPFLDDEDLEGRRLERVQGWALIFAAVVAIALPVYWLREPGRQHDITHDVDEGAIERGAVLFANKSMPEYDAAGSKLCADCHGTKGEGGTTSYRVSGEPVAWKVPPLNSEYLRFTEDPACLDPSLRQPETICEMSDIITYGRAGTPMQGWGVPGGGPLNDQSISDLVAYIESITLTPTEARALATKQLADAKAQPTEQVAAARTTLADDQKALAAAARDTKKALGIPSASDAELTTTCTQIAARVEKNPKAVDAGTKKKGIACGTYLAAADQVDQDRKALDWAIDWAARRANVSDGQLLFELNCARCHTEGWSIFNPTAPPGTPGSVDVLGLSGGGGGTGGGSGFNLRDGGEARRFGSDEQNGFQYQVDFVTKGSDPHAQYGNGTSGTGIGTGRMPGFGQMLTEDQIKEIVSYERYCLETTNYKGVSPACETGTKPRVAPATTTIPTTTTAPQG